MQNPGSNLRADVRRLGELLGETLVRQEGRSLLDLVESVRLAVREESPLGANILEEVDVSDSIKLVRAFSTYFHLANIAEQFHRSQALSEGRVNGQSWLQQTFQKISDAKISRDELARAVAALSVRPVFTAHPTEAARRSVLSKLGTVAQLLGEKNIREREKKLAEAIELLWQTDELRLEQPEPLDEATNALYYLDDLHRYTVPQVLDDFAFELAQYGIALDPVARPLSFGSWIGGDRDGNPNLPSPGELIGALTPPLSLGTESFTYELDRPFNSFPQELLKSSQPTDRSEDSIQGTVRISPDLLKQVSPTDKLIIMLFDPGQGRPVAFKFVESPSFPMEFQIGPSNAMGSVDLVGPYSLRILTDKDGQPFQAAEGELIGRSKDLVPLGTSNLDFVLDSPYVR